MSGAFLDRRVMSTEEQLTVIEAPCDDWLLVEAGPGTGKTQVAAMRLVHLLRQGLQPAQILVLSFSRSAVSTLTRRLKAVDIGEEGVLEDLRHLAIRTFDSWAFRMLRTGGVPAIELLKNTHDQNIEAVTQRLLDHADSAMSERLSAIRHVIVDEFQDLPGVRAEMVSALLGRLNDGGNARCGFTVLGDPAQAIYRFAALAADRNASLDPWLDIRHRMGSRLRTIVLTSNHRSIKRLADMAARLRTLLASNDFDAKSKLLAIQTFLSRIPASISEGKLDATWLASQPEGTTAILTRTNGEALMVCKMLLGNSCDGPNVPIRLRLSGTPILAPAWIAALLAKFKPQTISRKVFEIAYDKASEELDSRTKAAIQLPPMNVAWRRLAHASGASDGVGALDLDELRRRIYWPDSFPDDQTKEDTAVVITTIHQAKGMEFDNVALLESAHQQTAGGVGDPLEEANVGFVAVTRSGKHLGRLPSACVLRAPTGREFRGGRRLQSWSGMVNFQIGLPGDVEASAFVELSVHGSEAAVVALQDALLAHAGAWRWRKVVLRQVNPGDSKRARDVRYDIHLQTDGEDGLLLGRTSGQVTIDLLDLLWKPGYSLPRTIYNLRIDEIFSTSLREETSAQLPEPWKSSRLCLAVSLCGTGDFKPWRRHAN